MKKLILFKANQLVQIVLCKDVLSQGIIWWEILRDRRCSIFPSEVLPEIYIILINIYV